MARNPTLFLDSLLAPDLRIDGESVSPRRKVINFLGDVSAVDNPGTGATDITIPNVASRPAAARTVRAATTENVTLSGPQTVDSVVLVTEDRVLVKDQTTGAQNGLWVVKSGAWVRAEDYDNSDEITVGTLVYAAEGSANVGRLYKLVTTGTILVGTTVLTFVDLDGGIFHARHYGTLTASSSGAATANTTAITATMTAASAAGGGVVQVPHGAYHINSTLTVPSNIELRILGKLYLADNSNCYMLAIDEGATHVRIIGGELDGNKANQSGVNGGIGSADALSRDVLIQGIYVHDCIGAGIRVSGFNYKVLDSTVDSNGVEGITGSSLNYFVFANNYARLNATHNIGLIGVGTYGLIANNVAEASVGADNYTGYNASNQFVFWLNNEGRGGGNNGVHVGGSYITFSDNLIEDATDYGLIARNHDASTMVGFTALGNTITNSGSAAESAVWLGFLSDFKVCGNTIRNSTAHGILVKEGCVDGKISGNMISDTSGDGVRLEAVGGACSQISITDNTLIGNASDGIQVTDCTEIFIEGNDCKDNARPLTVSGSSANVRVIGNDFLGNTSDIPALTAGTIDYWANSPNTASVSLASAATLTLPVTSDDILVTGTTDPTSITASWAGRRVTLRFDSALTVTDTGNIKIAGSFLAAADSSITLVCDGTDWWEVARVGPSGQVAASGSEDVASAGATANIDIPIAASTSYSHIIQVRSENATPARCTVRCAVDTIRSGSGAPTTSGATIVFQSGTGLSVSATISSNNLRIATTNSTGADAHITTRVWEVERDATVEDS